MPPLSVMKIRMVLSRRPVCSRNVFQLAEVLVQIGDHAEELRGRPRFLVRRGVLLGHPGRAVRRVGGQVAEERLAVCRHVAHPLHGLAEPEIGAVALEALGHALVQVAAVEIVVVELGGGATCRSRGSSWLPGSRGPWGGTGRCRPGATCRRRRWHSRWRRTRRPWWGCRAAARRGPR